MLTFEGDGIERRARHDCHIKSVIYFFLFIKVNSDPIQKYRFMVFSQGYIDSLILSLNIVQRELGHPDLLPDIFMVHYIDNIKLIQLDEHTD